MIFQENDFLKTYTEIDKLWESPTVVLEPEVDSSITTTKGLTVKQLDTYLEELNATLSEAVRQLPQRFSGISMKGSTIFFDSRQGSLRMTGPFLRQKAQTTPALWEYSCSDKGQRFGDELSNEVFELEGTWIGFYFFTGYTGKGMFRQANKPSADLVQELIASLSEFCPQFNWADCQLTYFTWSRFKGAYGLCVKYSDDVSDRTLSSLVNILDIPTFEEGPAPELLNCVKEICSIDKSACVGLFLEDASLASLKETAFLVPGLVYYYTRGTQEQRSQLAKLLSTYYGKMTIAGGKNSLQYLANAGKQELQLSKVSRLKRNTAATRITVGAEGEELAFHYLVPKIPKTSISQWNSKPDFNFIGDLETYSVDAKIYGSVQKMWYWINEEEKSLHNATYIIVYLLEGKWLLLRKHGDSWLELCRNSIAPVTHRYTTKLSIDDLILFDIVKTLPILNCIKLTEDN